MKALIGYTGFVGSNIITEGCYDEIYNSKNIENIVGKKFDTIVCAGIRAEKYLANMYAEQDLDAIKSLIEILKTVSCKKFVLISTVDIYKIPVGVNENTKIVKDDLHPYGLNRYFMEEFVRTHFKDYLIVRLPALFGKNLKKNFIYDMIHKIPSLIMEQKFNELIEGASSEGKQVLKKFYIQNKKGNWEVRQDIDDDNRQILINVLEELEFTSLVFTDCRSRFPFYDLGNLQKDIDWAIVHDIEELNLAVEPISAQEIANECFNTEFSNIIENKKPVLYDMRSIYAEKWKGKDGYLYSKEDTLKAIKNFITNN